MKAILALATMALGFGTVGLSARPAPQAEADATRQLAIVPTIAASRPKATKAEARSAYLLAYFKDETHSLYFATSPDGYTFTDVNGGEPVLAGRAVADQKGLRDPHIMRGPDGAFYLSMTDLHIYGQREGLRTTQWERPENEFGWGNNRNLLLMKSNDLLHWTLAKVDMANLFPTYAKAGNAWAPETIWDPAKKRMMVYFTTRIGNGPNFMVYSYANPAFTTLTTEPKKILEYPRPEVNVIDADITKVGDKYHMFYVAHEKPGSIRQAVSSRIDGGYVYDPRKVDPENVAAEAPTLWRRHGTNTYVLMYDVFGAKPNNMGFAETTDFQTFRNIGRFNDAGSRMKTTNFTGPKHGAVMAITPDEADRLRGYFAR
ncbi:beta-xylosidase [Sphingomonas sp. Leaf339]|uniref:glycoside hydrolase family 43 protein n=1 Tax=Sphingomonas sp. Leaf339 TaxID=1736343 RepID=UPI0006F87AFB|nr:glycoside hydrolase family 43 protein [Sphingomonas sp. Leaf339]KQU46041.1 beta-xylosidase [Sphingomonas sp. Leaf339]